MCVCLITWKAFLSGNLFILEEIMNSKRSTTFNLTRCGILAAIAAILFLPIFEIPIVAFYKLDFSTFPAILAAFAMGPIQGVAVVLLKDIFHLTMSSTSGIGELADFIMSCAYIIPASLIYRTRKTRKNALIGMMIGTVVMIIVASLVNNYIMLPMYQNFMPIEAIIAAGTKVLPFIDTQVELICFITAPFNLIKGFALSLVTFLLYKHVSPLLHNK